VARTRVVMKWARTAEEPSYLVTNLRKGARRVSRIYAGRMQEEESFRDMKSHRYGFALRYVKLSHAERYERLMAIWAVGMWLFFAQGAAAVKADLHLPEQRAERPPRAQPRPDRQDAARIGHRRPSSPPPNPGRLPGGKKVGMTQLDMRGRQG